MDAERAPKPAGTGDRDGAGRAADPGLRIDLHDRLLAEAVRLHEEAQEAASDEPAAEARARDGGGDLEQRIVARAHALRLGDALNRALRQFAHAVAVVVAIGAILTALAGAATARAALDAGNSATVNFFWVLGGTLGVNGLALMVWVGVMLLRPRALGSGSLGGAVLFLGRRLSHWLHRGPAQLAAVRAIGSVYARSPIGRWSLSAISHGLWLSFMTGNLVMVLLLLSAMQYDFVWETTILSQRTYVPLTRLIAAAPEAMGFPTPDTEQIRASRRSDTATPPATLRGLWSGLLVGSIVVYGVLPRMALLLLCVFLRRRAAARFRLDTTLPGYARLQSRLLPDSRAIGIVDEEMEIAPSTSRARGRYPARALPAEGPIAIMGLEIEAPASAWPPIVAGVEWLDLGVVDTREDRRAAMSRLETTPAAPRMVLVVCALASTPDRGTGSFLGDLEDAFDGGIALLLTGGQRLRTRSPADEVEQRLADWLVLAGRARIPGHRVIDLDLDHLTEASRARLAAFLGSGSGPVVAHERLETAFEVILEHLAGWSQAPAAAQQAELHRAIAALYRGEGGDWQRLIRARIGAPGDLAAQLKTSANQVVQLLPSRLQKDPIWFGAGAMAGALGCVAAATLASPAAIAALPLWAGLGAALGAWLGPSGSARQARAGGTQNPELTQAVRSAALFAILLELQGRDEVEITHILDRVATADEAAITDVASARRWLDALKARFDRVLAAKGAP